MAFQSSYRYTVEMSYIDSNNKEFRILPECISNIVIDYDYDNHIMPILYVILNLELPIYNRMQDTQFAGKILLSLYKYNKDGTSSGINKYISDQFDYIMKEDPNSKQDEKDEQKKLEDESIEDKRSVSGDDTKNGDRGLSYKPCIIGLVKMDLVKANRREFNGIYKNTNVSALIQDATKHMKMVIEPFTNNQDIEELIVPHIESVGQFIAYINEQYGLYNAPYCYFLDFDKTYIKSNSGKWIDANDGQFPYIAIDVRDMKDHKTMLEGFVIDELQDAYILYVDAANANISPDNITPNITGNVLAIDEEGKIKSSSIDTSMITNVHSDVESKTIVKSDTVNASKLIAAVAEQQSATLAISKAHTDHSIYTPNKEYLLSNYEGNSKYTGRYYMCSKKEVYQRVGPELTALIMLQFRLASHYEMDKEKAKKDRYNALRDKYRGRKSSRISRRGDDNDELDNAIGRMVRKSERRLKSEKQRLEEEKKKKQREEKNSEN